jgi:dipeptidyl aminopeptidase/acylaminoacyl peptidase
MTRTEERLADALDAAARALREDALRPLLAPGRRHHRPTLAAPLAAAAALLLVVGIGVAVAKLAAPQQPPSTTLGPPPYYVEAGFAGGLPQVRSTATGAVTDTVRVPYVPSGLGPNMVAAAGNGVFFAAVTQQVGERIYRFRLTAGGRVSHLAPVPGSAIGDSQWGIGAMAASPDGSRLAVGLTPTSGTYSAGCSSSGPCSYTYSGQNGSIDIIDTANGERSVWQGGTGPKFLFTVVSLSWTGSGNELAYLGEWCPQSGGSSASSCLPGTGTGGAKAQVWTLDPTTGGGSLTSGRLLFGTSAAFPDLPQALISPDGSTITAASITSSAEASGTPSQLAVEQISVATRRPLRVLYRQDLRQAFGANNPQGYVALLTLKSDLAAQYWMVSGLFCSVTRCNGGVNGWIDGGRLVPLQPAGQNVGSEAW